MRYSPDRARLEASLATAHRALFRAQAAAESEGDEATAYDLGLLLQEVTRLADRSLNSKRRKRPLTSHQMGLLQTDDP